MIILGGEKWYHHSLIVSDTLAVSFLLPMILCNIGYRKGNQQRTPSYQTTLVLYIDVLRKTVVRSPFQSYFRYPHCHVLFLHGNTTRSTSTKCKAAIQPHTGTTLLSSQCSTEGLHCICNNIATEHGRSTIVWEYTTFVLLRTDSISVFARSALYTQNARHSAIGTSYR